MALRISHLHHFFVPKSFNFLFVVLFTCFFFFSKVNCENSDLRDDVSIVKSRIFNSLLCSKPQELLKKIERWMKSLSSDGSWPDIGF